MIKTQGLFFEYKQLNDEANDDDKAALSNISLNIEAGEFVAILGHNGSGKSTLAKQLNALLLPTRGTVWVSGYQTSSATDIWHVRQNAGMVFQNPDNQMVATIVEEDVAFGPENLSIKPIEIRHRVNEALAAVGMADFADAAPHFLSGGQKQRVAIAGILAMKPSCIILDEPTAMLDPLGRKEVIDTVLRLNKEEDITVILITHFMDEAAKARRVIVMDKGAVVMDDAPKGIFSQADKLKSLGLDVPQVVEVAHHLRECGVNLPAHILSVEEMIQEVVAYYGKNNS